MAKISNEEMLQQIPFKHLLFWHAELQDYMACWQMATDPDRNTYSKKNAAKHKELAIGAATYCVEYAKKCGLSPDFVVPRAVSVLAMFGCEVTA